jgi:uncharacterized protein YciI
MTALPPIHREVVVAAPATTAFALFTAHLGAWWPLALFSVFGVCATVAFEGDRVVERFGSGESTWAEVVAFDPPKGFELAWHPGRDAEFATTIRVTFAELNEQTLVTLEHYGWERIADPAAARAEYDGGWPTLLAGFQRLVEAAGARSESIESDRWYTLVHRPGAAISGDQTVFAHPDFAEHVAFLNRLAERGVLVAAGPLPEQPGTGMTEVKVNGAEVDLTELSNTDDQSVVRGLLTVDVQPWDVKFTEH